MSMTKGDVMTEQIQHLPGPAKSSAVSDELTRIRDAVGAVLPRDAHIFFHFDTRLHLHIDVRNLEDVSRLEVVLPSLCGGIFSNLQRGLVDNHPFLHRLTALVDR
jgi:hypothetical protein